MQLESFRIRNCFGFIDSGIVNLIDRHNFIYLLGRNSSGKSSFLNSLKYFGHGVIPGKQRNFENFNPSEERPSFSARFRLAEGEISSDRFINDFYGAIDKWKLRGETQIYGNNFKVG